MGRRDLLVVESDFGKGRKVLNPLGHLSFD